MKRIIVAIVLCALASGVGAVEWRNIDDEHYLGGRKASEGYLQGKVVLVDRWGLKCPPCRAMLPRIEEIWQSYKTKSFVAIGGHCKGWGDAEGIKDIIKQNSLTYPIYEGASLSVGEPLFDAIPFLYVVDETGKVVYFGRDDRAAIQAIVTALTDMDAPRNLAQWKRFLDFELEKLPGKAYLRMAEFKKKFPKEAKEYEAKFKELQTIPDIKKLSELVAFAKKSKDMRAFNDKQKTQRQKFVKLIKDAIPKYASLKESKDSRVVQEAKNSIADLQWTLAAFNQ